MADSAVAITAGTGTNIDSRTESTNGNHRQVVVLGDPSTNAGVAPVDGTKGLAVDLTATGANTVPILATMATLPVVASGSIANAGGSLSAFQGGNWLVSVATLPVMANIVNSSIPVTQSGTWDEVGINDSGNSITVDNGGTFAVQAAQSGTWTVQPGNTPNSTGWLVTMATLPVVASGSLQAAGGSFSAFQGGAWNVGINAGTNNIGDVDILSIAAGDNNIGNVDAIQSGTWTVQPGNTPNTVAWLVTMATLPVVTSVNVAGQATVTALQGDAGSQAWRVTMATLPVVAQINNSTIAVTQSGTWDEVGINDSGNSITIDGNVGIIGGSISVWNAGGSLSAFQGGSWNVWASMMSNTIIQVGDNGGSLTIDGTVTANLSTTDNAVLDDIAADTEAIKTSLAGTLTVTGGGGGVEYTEGDIDATITGSAIMWEDTSDTLRTVSAAKPLPVDIQDSTLAVIQSGTWTVQPGNTPNSTAWLVTMATLPVVGDFQVSSVGQGAAGSSAWLVTMATLPVMANVVNSTLAVTQSGTWDEVGINDSGNSITVDNGGTFAVQAAQSGTWTVQPGNTPNTTAWLVTMATLSTINRSVGGSLSAYVFGGSLSAFNAGGSLSAFQGGTWNVFSSMASGTNFIAGGQYLPTLASLSSMAHTPLKTDMFSNLMVNINVPLQNNTRLNRFYSFASMASLMAAPGAGRRLVVREMDISAAATLTVRLVEDQGGTPATVWGPHYFLPYAGITKNNCYIALTSNKSLGVNASGIGDMQIDLRVETENT